MALPDRLEGDSRSPTVTAFPDGSVDTFYEVFDGGDRVRSREEFGERVATEGPAEFSIHRQTVGPGGHAVNTAVQADLLGNDVVLAGHLDDPVFAELSVETVSMGAPAHVSIYEFEDDDVLATENSDDVEEWTLADLRTATDDAFGDLLSADVVFCSNWTSFDALPEALATLADADLDGGHFVFDPGAMSGRSDEAVRGLFDALAGLEGGYDVVLAANASEVDAMASAFGVDVDGGVTGSAGSAGETETTREAEASLGRLREAAHLSAVVLHEAELAAVATPDDGLSVENYDVDAVRSTGGGDRFDAGLAHALARGWDWETALRLGNACASRYVATGESATPGELAAFLREHE